MKTKQGKKKYHDSHQNNFFSFYSTAFWESYIFLHFLFLVLKHLFRLLSYFRVLWLPYLLSGCMTSFRVLFFIHMSAVLLKRAMNKYCSEYLLSLIEIERMSSKGPQIHYWLFKDVSQSFPCRQQNIFVTVRLLYTYFWVVRCFYRGITYGLMSLDVRLRDEN